MSHKLCCLVHELSIDRVLHFPLHGYGNGFLHFIAHHFPHTFFSAVSFFHNETIFGVPWLSILSLTGRRVCASPESSSGSQWQKPDEQISFCASLLFHCRFFRS